MTYVVHLDRPDTAAYRAGPWPTDMRHRGATDENRKPTGRFTFLDGFLWWSSVEARVRVEMVTSELWGCADLT